MPRSFASSLLCPRTLIGPSVTFSSTVLWANRLNDWKTMPTSARSSASALPSSGSFLPSIAMVPSSIVSRRLMARQSVDLPEPEGPITTTTSPGVISRLMSCSTCSSPNHFWTSCIETMSVGSAMRFNLASPVGTPATMGAIDT